MSTEQDKNTSIENLIAKVLSIMSEIEARKALYDELDRLTLELRNAGFQAGEYEGKSCTLVDNFEEKNVQWRMAAVRRWELKVRDAHDAEPARRKRAK